MSSGDEGFEFSHSSDFEFHPFFVGVEEGVFDLILDYLVQLRPDDDG